MTERLRFACLLAVACAAAAAGVAHADSGYHEDTFEPLASDLRARYVGDLLTVLIVEESRSAATSSADTERETAIQIQGAAEITDVTSGEATGSAAIAHEFNGQGAITRTGRLVARVSVTVVDVLPNGDLVVNGSQQIVFNQEVQSIVVNGQVRPEDIQRDNTVFSPRLANAAIEYTGDGILANAEAKSWFSMLFDWIF